MSLPGLFSVSATTEMVTVYVHPIYRAEDSDPEAGHWLWHYHIRVENGGGVAVQLIDRHWIIIDGKGMRRDVMGDGVVGEQPLIAPGESFDYVSGCPLTTPWGSMQGRFGMVDSGGRRFEVAIPHFHLLSPDVTRQ